MKRKLFFLLPDVNTARKMMDQMLLARIEEQNIHFLAKSDLSPEGLPEATVVEKTDSLHGVGVGAIIGGVCGVLGGLLVVVFPALFTIPSGSEQTWHMLEIVAIGLVGAAFGAWWTGMAMAVNAVPNSSLEPYKDRIAHGEVLMIVSVPYQRIREVRALVTEKCGDICNYVGVTPTDHVMFP